MTENISTLPKFTELKRFNEPADSNISVMSSYFSPYTLCFYNSLKKCNEEGFRPVFIPEHIDLKINLNERYGEKPDDVRWVSPSAKIFGKSKKGNKIVVYAHVPHFFSNVENFSSKSLWELSRIFSNKETPQSEIERLLELENNENIFVHDYSFREERKKIFGLNEIGINELLEKTRIASLLGGRKRAERFLGRIKKGIDILEIDDLDRYCGTGYANTALIDFTPSFKISTKEEYGLSRLLGIKDYSQISKTPS